MCYPEIMNLKIKNTQIEFFKRERQSFKEDITNHYWKKYWVITVLKAIDKKEDLKPAIHSFFSIQRLQYIDKMSYNSNEDYEK